LLVYAHVKAVQHRYMVFLVKKRLVLMLAVYVHKQIAYFFKQAKDVLP
jgi:hypothetical protein